ncbi:MAG: hypothetical protein HY856_16040 [Burkholderiales bacterium]|nr:hypothetical protein [Burkholderiales bacterium]
MALALFLDPSCPTLSMVNHPGVLHLPVAHPGSRTCRLVHAKVALLGFRHAERPDAWCVRLLVSTGNWTRQTVEDSLDLAWRLDVFSDDIAARKDASRAACADIVAAHGLMNALRQGLGGVFDVRLLRATPQLAEDQALVDRWISQCARHAAGKPRFFDSRSRSLLAQLPGKIRSADDGRAVARNYIAMGSGFYEPAPASGGAPRVPMAILETLRGEGLLTLSCETDLFVNRLACQGVAMSVRALDERGVTVRPAAAPSLLFGEDNARTLHAKFLFSAHQSARSARCSSAWVYLGSGNLTEPGFTRRMGPDGNLEAGVVFCADGLVWQGGAKVDASRVVSHLLPIQRDEAVSPDSAALTAGPPYERPPVTHLAPPIAWLVWTETDDCPSRLVSPEPLPAQATQFQVLGPDEQPCPAADGGFVWHAPMPRQVRCRWTEDGQVHNAEIPVVDAHGRIAAMPLQPLGIEEAWWQLADFPQPPPADAEDADGDGAADPPPQGAIDTRPAAPGSYPVRQLMELVEQIAARQTALDERDWAAWCRRMEQTLTRAKDSPAVAYFRHLGAAGLNPLSPLRQAPFRPGYAETADTAAGLLYEQVLDRIEAQWGVAGMPGV